jgi:hypothetical protein
MGGYSGSPKVTLKNNKDLLGQKKRLTRKEYIGVKENYTEDHLKASPELLQKIRLKTIRANKKRKKSLIISGVFSLIIILILLYFINSVEFVGIQLH